MSYKFFLKENLFDIHEIFVFDIPYIYTPFYEITESNVEETLTKVIEYSPTRGLYGIFGETGSGKSSLVNYGLWKYWESKDIFTFKISLYTEENLTNRTTFVKFILNDLYDIVSDESIKILESERENIKEALAGRIKYASERRIGFISRFKSWLSFIPVLAGSSIEVGADIEKVTKTALEQQRYNIERIECINDLISAIRVHGYKKVIIVLDDADKFLGGVEEARRFIHSNLGTLRQVNACFLILFNKDYLQDTDFNRMITDYFSDAIRIPHITNIEGIRRILDKRITVGSDGEKTVDEVFQPEAIEELFDIYRDTRRLRSVIKYANGGMIRASIDKKTKVGRLHVKKAREEDTMP